MTAPRITDHAVIRYLERRHGIDIEALRERMTAELIECGLVAAQLGISSYTVKAEDIAYIVRDLAVVTVLPAKPFHKESSDAER